MAEEFHLAGICGGNWWINSSLSSQIIGGSSPCFMENNSDHHLGAYGYGSRMDAVDLKTSWSCKETSIASPVLSDRSVAFQSLHKPPHHQQANSDGGGSTIFTDSTLQMMGFGLSAPSSSSLEWSHALLPGSGRAGSYNPMVHQEDMNSGLNSTQIQKEWSPKSFTSTSEDSSINALKAINQNFPLDQRRLNPINSSGNSVSTCQNLSTGFSMGNISATYGYPSPLVQSLFEPGPPQPQQALFNNCPTSMNCSSSAAPNYGINLNDLSSSWPNIAPLPKQEPSSLHFSNNTPFWNASATRTGGVLDSPPHSQPLLPTLEGKLNCPNLDTKPNNEDARCSGSVGKKGSEPSFKRPRIETPSPLPTFKVRKEKIGDRITALQQLVSPFGKTDTASVLNEAIEYIKFLHDQVNVLSSPYMKNGDPTQNHQQVVDKSKIQEGLKQDLRSRGLCLVPISSTFPVAQETTADFWTPTFGGTFR